MKKSDSNGEFIIEPNNKFFEAIRATADFELSPGPSVTFLGDVDLTLIEVYRSSKSSDPKPSYTALVAKAVARALTEFPYANRRICRLPGFVWLKFGMQRFRSVDIAIGIERNIVDSESVAFLDVIRRVEVMSVSDIQRALSQLTEANGVPNQQWQLFHKIITRLPGWLSILIILIPHFFPKLWVKYRGGAVLISSPTKYGVDAVVAKQAYPLSISFGIAKLRPVVKKGQVVPCLTFTLGVNFDRRVMAGAQAARFFRRVVEILEHADF